MTTQLVTIYGLQDNNSLLIRYIGKANNMLKRFRQHLNTCQAEQNKKAFWLRDNRAGVQVVAIAQVPVADWQAWERFYINFYNELYREAGLSLLLNTLPSDPKMVTSRVLGGRSRANDFTSDYQSQTAKAGAKKRFTSDYQSRAGAALAKAYDLETRRGWARAGGLARAAKAKERKGA